MPPKAVDEGGHETVPAHCLVPPESERHAGREVDARKRFTRNHRSRGHGPLLQKARPFPRSVVRHEGCTRGPPLVGTPCGQAAAGRQAREAAMARSYRKRGHFRGRWCATGDIQGALPLLVRPAAKPPRAVRPERRPWAAPTESAATSAVGGAPRGIYKGPSPCWYALRPSRRGPSGPRGGHRPLLQKARPLPRSVVRHGGYTRGPPLVGTPFGQAAAGRQAREAAMARSYRKGVHFRGRWCATGDIQGALPLLVRPAAKPPRAVRPERRPWAAPTESAATSAVGGAPRGIYKGPSPCWYALRPSRRGPSGPRGGHPPLLQKVARAQGLGAGENHWYALRPTSR